MKGRYGIMKVRLLFLLLVIFSACTEDKEKKTAPKKVPVKKVEKKPVTIVDTPSFDENSAYNFIDKQVAFGPRIPNSEAHKKCARYLLNKLAEFGLDTIGQRTVVRAFNGKELKITNIIGQFNPEAPNRILLSSHWDARPFADRSKKKRAKAFDSANDGASGVGVLLEIARAISESQDKPSIGFDIIFFDAEDYGQPNESMHMMQDDTWCLGSQYWSRNMHKPGYRAKYGILLDMVGAENAVFPKEELSMYYAGEYTNRVWDIAKELGHSKYFIDRELGRGLTDDHKYVNEIAKIPCMDIIHFEIERQDFGTFHHTHADNMSIINKTTLKAVGETILQVLYQES